MVRSELDNCRSEKTQKLSKINEKRSAKISAVCKTKFRARLLSLRPGALFSTRAVSEPQRCRCQPDHTGRLGGRQSVRYRLPAGHKRAQQDGQPESVRLDQESPDNVSRSNQPIPEDGGPLSRAQV